MPCLESISEPFLATRALRVSPIENAFPKSSTPSPRQTNDDDHAEKPRTVGRADIVRDDLTGFCLRQYFLGPKIGGGGMGKVFLARHMQLERDFAIKFMAADISELTEAQTRFERETQALGRLQHPQIVDAVDAGCSDGLKYLVTEFVDGEDLAQLVHRRGAIPVTEACELMRQVALGLAFAHAHDFVHRDIKPSNLIVNRDGVVKILDFGLVCNANADHQLTDHSDPVGTWDFLAPEQASDACQVDHRSDIYSLGCTLLYLISGKVPFSGARYATPAAKLKAHLFDLPEWMKTPSAKIPADLRHILTRMLAKSPSQRFKTASEVAAALASFITPANDSTTKPKPNPAMQSPLPFRTFYRRFAIALVITILTIRMTFFQLQTGAGSPVQTEQKPHEISIRPFGRTHLRPTNTRSFESNAIVSFPTLMPQQDSKRVVEEPRHTSNSLPVITPYPTKVK